MSMSTIKVTVNLTQYERHDRTKAQPDRYVYFVESLTNTTVPAVGSMLSEDDVKTLIIQRVIVNIKKGK